VRIAGQESLLPATSATRPSLSGVEMVTGASLAEGPASVVAAAGRVLGVSNGTTANATTVLAAFAALPRPESRDAISTGGGPLVLLRGKNLGPGSAFVAAVWAQRPGHARLDVFSQDVDEPQHTGLPPPCSMAVPHRALLCQVPPGAGGGFVWFAQILDQGSNGAAGTGYAEV